MSVAKYGNAVGVDRQKLVERIGRTHPDWRDADDLSRVTSDFVRRMDEMRDRLELRARDDPTERLAAGVTSAVVRHTIALSGHCRFPTWLARHEFVLAPIQALCGFESETPIERFDWSQ